MNKYRFTKTRNRGFRRPKDGAISPSVEGRTLCSINDKSSLESQLAVSQAISPAAPLSNSREKLTIETNDTMHKSGNQSCSESKQPAKPNCYKCVYRGNIPGNAHSRCMHPKIKPATDDPIIQMFSMLGSRGLKSAGINLGGELGDLLGVTGNKHGIDSGWFNWPINFDPVWLDSCDGFKARKTE